MTRLFQSLLVLGALCLAAPGMAQETTRVPREPGDPLRVLGPVIPGGQEELLATMLGRGATLPGGCEFASGQATGPVLESVYTCPGGEVVYELRHPDQAPAGSIRTEKFAISLRSGTPPDGLGESIATLVRTHEPAFNWLILEPPRAETSAAQKTATLLALIALAIGVAVLGWALQRRFKRRSAEG